MDKKHRGAVQKIIEQQQDLKEREKPELQKFAGFDSTTNSSSAVQAAVKKQQGYLTQISKVIRGAVSEVEPIVKTIPQIEFPDVISDGNIEKLANNNSKFGWTLSNEINLSLYLNDDLLGKDQYDIDEVFTEYFEANAGEYFYVTANEIMDTIDEKWKKTISDCFELYKTSKFRVIIPMLISIIEGEIAKIADTNRIGNKLKIDWSNRLDSISDEKIILIAAYSLNNFLWNSLFIRDEFEEERKYILNRHRVMHGRDNPNEWTRTDVLRLISNISTLQMIQN